MVIVRATFQATDLPVLTLTAGPKIVTPALAASSICSRGQSPASRMPSYSSSPCMPSTNSLAMPIWMPRSGNRARMRSMALSAARKSASPAAPAVSRSMKSAPASAMLAATKTMSSAASSHRLFLGGARLVDLAHRQELRPVGDRTVGHGVRPRSGMAPYPHGAVSRIWPGA